jgi:ABC-type branched-subunit amino acid transport system substrate-binding protein
MILVRNRQPRLNGNKLFWLLAFIVVFAACSPKVTKPVVKTKPEAPKVEKPDPKFTEGHISVLIPFKLNQFNFKALTKSQVNKANMALDFYQGLMMGIDSASYTGLNFKVNVFDSRDDDSRLSVLSKKEALANSNLLIGPIFPDELKAIAAFSKTSKMPVVSPLAASKPTEFNNPNLISIVNNIDQHGEKIADYIAKHFNAAQTIVVLINTKKTADDQFAAPIRKRFAQKYANFIVQQYTSTYVFETKMIKGKKYAVVLCSDDTRFVSPSLTKLYKLKNLSNGGYNINLFGHPNWAKQTYNIDQLQDLNTIISSSYHIDYDNKQVVNFIKAYRHKYDFEPTEYAFKGFDIGFYFGQLLAKRGASFVDFLVKDKYKGLHNDFDFGYNAEYGFYNKHLLLLQYKDLAISPLE